MAAKTVLVPTSAHGTNPATAALAGYQVAEIAQTSDATSTWPTWRKAAFRTSPR